MDKIVFPAEWTSNTVVQLTWPHMGTDWHYMIEQVTECFLNIAHEILKRQDLMVVCRSKSNVLYELKHKAKNAKGRLLIKEIKSNDTWARDHGGITIFKNGIPHVCDFTFNGWGLKFAADKDNRINRNLYETNTFQKNVIFESHKEFVLEGGAIESDGKGTILTTSKCLLSPNRNSWMTKTQIENYLKEKLGAERILWLNNGYLSGDDTDSHIDTLARFCNEHTIAYVQCNDKEDEHYEELQKMERELMQMKDFEGNPYKLIPLPWAPVVRGTDNHRLPATYANFLILNDVILMPTYHHPSIDAKAKKQLGIAFPGREIVGVNSLPLIQQHGSLHCITMQYPEGVIDMKDGEIL